MSQRDSTAVSGTLAALRPAESSTASSRAVWEVAAPAPTFPTIPLSTPSFDVPHLLEWALERGLISQLPHPTVGAGDGFRRVLNRIFPSPTNLSATPFVEPFDPFDADLDGPQRDAAARALETPDIMLIQGLPGTGKTRVIAEIVRQATARQQRVLFLAPQSAAIDAVFAHLGNSVDAVRCLGPEERIDSLPTGVAAMTGKNREQSVRVEWLRRARDGEIANENARNRLRAEVDLWDRIYKLTEVQARCDHDRAALRQQRDALPEMVRCETAECDPPRHLDQAHTEPIAQGHLEADELQKLRSQHETERRQIIDRLEALKPLEDAAHSGRFWSMTFWKAKLSPTLHEEFTVAQAQIEAADEALRKIDEREAILRRERDRAESARTTARSRLIEDEMGRRLAEIDGREADLLRQVEPVSDQIRQLRATFDGEISEGALLKLERADRELAGARRWREFVEGDPDILVRRWRNTVALVAGPLAALDFEPWMKAPEPPFDLLIVDEAHSIAENDLLAAGKRANRWVFVGEPAQAMPAVAQSRPVPSRGSPPRRARSAPDFFARLWDQLHRETWGREGDRLCCRLHPVAAADRRHLESEFVADRADVELRISSSRAGDPFLAEVLFPAGTNLADAQEYLFHELGEIPCPSRFRTARWTSSVDGSISIFRLNPLSSPSLPPRSIALETGISLRVHDASPSLDHSDIALIFDEREGWNRERAEGWVTQHLSMRDTGRTCRLETSYRHAPNLAAWLNEAAFMGCRYPVDQRIDGAVQFEAVPRRTPAGGQRRGGAGFEIDLGDPQQRELLPTELAAKLPAHGCVNLPEAQAIADLAQRLNAPSAVITAPYPAQVALLRLLCPSGSRVVHPAELAQKECDIVILSLTRSHVSRAVTFGDDPATMLQLLTRPRCRLIIAGDPGTLGRRAEWEGAIDHLDEMAGERERRWVNALLRFLPARAPQRVAQGARA